MSTVETNKKESLRNQIAYWLWLFGTIFGGLMVAAVLVANFHSNPQLKMQELWIWDVSKALANAVPWLDEDGRFKLWGICVPIGIGLSSLATIIEVRAHTEVTGFKKGDDFLLIFLHVVGVIGGMVLAVCVFLLTSLVQFAVNKWVAIPITLLLLVIALIKLKRA